MNESISDLSLHGSRATKRFFKLDELLVFHTKEEDTDDTHVKSIYYHYYVSWPIRVQFVRPGKWLLFPKNHEFPRVKERVFLLLAAKRLGPQILVNVDPENPTGTYNICVFTQDHHDIPDVFRVLVTLWRNRLANKRLRYKTDDATYQGLYASDYAAKRAGFDPSTLEKKRCSKYFSPKPKYDITGATEHITMFDMDNNSLVAEIRKTVGDDNSQITFYDTPSIFYSWGPPKVTEQL